MKRVPSVQLSVNPKNLIQNYTAVSYLCSLYKKYIYVCVCMCVCTHTHTYISCFVHRFAVSVRGILSLFMVVTALKDQFMSDE